MVTPFRPVTRQQSPSPSPPPNRRSSSTSHQHQHQHHHHHRQRPRQRQLTLSWPLHITDPIAPPTPHASSAATTPVGGERSSKRIKLTVRNPSTTASPAATRHGGAKKGDGSSLSFTDSSTNTTNTTTTTTAAAAATALRPPTRLTVAQPHGNIIQTTNGVRAHLDVAEDGLRTDVSRATTAEPQPSERRSTRGKQDRRSLRSHDDGPRLKSELAVYFPDYEDVIYDVPREPELLDINTVIHIRDDAIGPQQKAGPVTKTKDKGKADDRDTIHVGHQHLISPRARPPLALSGPLLANERNRFNGAQVVDFSTIEKSVGHHPRDPLTDAFYFKSHRRAERKEKQLRNIEKERAMHEKAQLERLLDGLQGHDWLRLMGITGITDTEAKRFEPKRDYFIDEVKALLMKFKTWKEEEKRLRLEKEAAALAEEEADEGDDEDAEGGAEEESDDGEPSSSDIDGAAAHQLQMEASGGAKKRGGKGGKAGKGAKDGRGQEREQNREQHREQHREQQQRGQQSPQTPLPPALYRPPTPEGPFVSFYSKPHLRAAALGKARHGRNLTAFGQPLPEPEEREFSLPEDYTTPEARKDSARRRRRMKRESVADSGPAK